MSKPIKELIRKELVRRFEGLTSLALVGFSGLDTIATHRVRARLLAKDIRLTVVKNSLARRAFKEVGLGAAVGLLDGPCAVAYGPENVVVVVRELLDLQKDFPALTVKAAVLEGEAFGSDRVEALSKFPTREEAIARLVGCILAPGGKLGGCVLAPGGKIAAILKTIQEKQGEAQEAQAA